MFYFINNTGQSQHFHFMGDQSKINIYDSENNKLDLTNSIEIHSNKINILYINEPPFGEEIYILNK
jgi:hypothetical protein